ncbi:MAG: hypothetical protein RL145_1093 [Pseudomonadota bacterium]
MTVHALDIGLILCALAMGFLVPRSTTCAVAAVTEVLDRKRAWRFGGFALASLSAMVLLWPIAWFTGLPIHFAPLIAPSFLIFLGGLIFGVGAALNGACVFGTLTKIVSGDTSYLFVLPGLWLGALLLGLTGLSVQPHIMDNPVLAAFGLGPALIWGLALGLLILLGWFFVRKGKASKAGSMAAIGVVGGLLYTIHPAWNYSVAIHNFAQAILAAPQHMADSLLPWLVGAACLGGVTSTLAAGTFKLKAPSLRGALGALLGGCLMAFGLVMIPGGNDGLILFLLPSLIGSGALAYVAMNLGIVGTLLLGRAFQLAT